ncbi:hypothetical protein HanLR1_Chr06g0205421 [Helianthus annuus]|nr:hypothetical protein HanLR1_Chr06g0205421 [Helianthus annuus]
MNRIGFFHSEPLNHLFSIFFLTYFNGFFSLTDLNTKEILHFPKISHIKFPLHRFFETYAPIQHMTCPNYCFCPKMLWHFFLSQKTSDHVYKGPVSSFCHPILLGCVGSSQLSLYPLLFTKYVKFL